MFKTIVSPEFSHKEVALYYNAYGSILHVITLDVYRDDSHKVVNSEIQLVPLGFNVVKVAAQYQKTFGAGNVCAYNVREVLL